MCLSSFLQLFKQFLELFVSFLRFLFTLRHHIRDALFPRDAYRCTWEQLELRLTQRQACQTIVALLGMAALDGVEAVLARRLEDLLESGELPDLAQLRAEFAPRKAEVPSVTVEMPAPGVYDALLPSQQEAELAEVAA